MCGEQQEKRTLFVCLTGTVGGHAGAGGSDAIGTAINCVYVAGGGATVGSLGVALAGAGGCMT